jgi:hypothetical protein
MDPLSPKFTRNLVRKTARIMAGMDRVMRPGGIATDEGLSAAVRAGMQHLAAHKGDVAAAIASAKAVGAWLKDSVSEVAVPTDAGVGKRGIHREFAVTPDQPDPHAEHSGKPRAVWHGFVPTSPRHDPDPDSIGQVAKEAWHLVESVGTFLYNHPVATLAALGTEASGGGPEDPVADGAVAGEVAAAEALGASAGTTRALAAADMGLDADSVIELNGEISTNGTNVTVYIGMIRAVRLNPFRIIGSLTSMARAEGATTLTIRGSIVNEQLLNIVIRRYGGQTIGGIEQIVIPIGK